MLIAPYLRFVGRGLSVHPVTQPEDEPRYAITENARHDARCHHEHHHH